MIYFIPAWYQNNEWCENEQIWYIRRTYTEFDDTVKHVQLFQRNDAYPYQILLLSFAPNFRHFLHRQGVYHAPYWSCFDAIQMIRKKKSGIVSFHDFSWPDGIEFMYTPFAVVARLRGKKYAQVDFGEDGNPIQIDIYRNDRVYRRIVIDDRGFIAARIIFDKEKPFYQEYLTEDRIWKLRCFQSDGHVEINPESANYLLVYRDKEQIKTFSRLLYDSLDQVVQEVLISYLNLTEENSLFCMAVHERHIRLLHEALKGRKTIFSFFSDRYHIEGNKEAQDMIEEADFIITDSRDNLNKIRRQVRKALKNGIAVTPYDFRMAPGDSQRLDVQKILVPVDDIDNEILADVIGLLGEYISKNEKIQVYLFTRKGDGGRKQQILSQTRIYLKQAGLEEKLVSDTVATPDTRFFVEQCVDEMAVSNCVRQQRIIVDMRNSPELYLQIMALSVGIPQIVRRWTEFIEERRNGIVLKKLDGLPEALDYYLNGLSNWNEALIRSFEIGREYTAQELINAWKGVIEFIG